MLPSLIENSHGMILRNAGSRTLMDQLMNGSFIRCRPPALAMLIRGIERTMAMSPARTLTHAFQRS